MMFETLVFLAAAAAGAAQSAPQADGCARSAVEAAPAVNPAIIEMTYDAFVATEETPDVRELARRAVGVGRDKPSIGAAAGTAWIS